MKRTLATLIASSLLLGGATAAATPAGATAAPLAVDAKDRERYWVPVSQDVSAALPGTRSPAALSTQVVVTYTIDGEGQVRDAVATSFQPERSRPDWAVQMVRKNRFKPGPDNPQRQAVRTSTEVTLGAGAAR